MIYYLKYKKSLIVVGVAAIFLAIFLHNSFFVIEGDKIRNVIAENLPKVEGKSYNTHDIKIRKELDLKFRKIIIYSFPSKNGNEIVGIADFYKGLNNKYAVCDVFFEKRFLYFRVVRDLSSQYLTISGKNYQRTISYIEVNQKNGNSYREDISKEDYFIFKVDVGVLRGLRMLDEVGNEIPLEFDDLYVEEKM